MDGFLILTYGLALTGILKSSSSLSLNPPFLVPCAIEGRGFLNALILGFLTSSEPELSLSSESCPNLFFYAVFAITGATGLLYKALCSSSFFFLR